MHRIRTAGLIAFIILFQGHGLSAQQSVTLQTGTVLDVYAVGVPDFRYRVPINAAGEASFPLMQPMKVAGLSLAEVRDAVKTALSKLVYRHRSSDGREVLVDFNADEIVVEVAEYPPVYVTGDVRNPGAVAYRPDLTVRQAIALAGGAETFIARTEDFDLRAAELRGEAQKLMLEQIALRGRRDGLQTLLDGGRLSTPDTGAAGLPVAPSAAREIERLKAVEAEIASEQAHIVETIADEKARLAEIASERELVREQLTAQELSSEDVRKLVERKIAPDSRLNDELRYLSDVRERALSLSLQQAQTEREIADLVRRRDALAAQHRIDLMADMQEANLRLGAIAADLGSLEERYGFANARLSSNGSLMAGPDIFLHRRLADEESTTPVDESALLRASDVLEVRVPRPSFSDVAQGL